VVFRAWHAANCFIQAIQSHRFGETLYSFFISFKPLKSLTLLSGYIANPPPLIMELELQQTTPLADRLRPQTIEEIVGQLHLTGPNAPLFDTYTDASGSGCRRLTTENIILWGPPG
jgi:hypothetical protein